MKWRFPLVCYTQSEVSFASPKKDFCCTGSFLAGVLEKAGIQPQVKRLGKYKSAGDQLARKDMSDAQKEQLTALLDDIYTHFKATISQAVGKTQAEVRLSVMRESSEGSTICLLHLVARFLFFHHSRQGES